MRPLFISYACDHCDGIDSGRLSEGFIVYRRRPWGSQEYVFSTHKDAERWRVINGLHGCPIYTVASETPFSWRKSGGFIEDLELADHLYEIYADHKYDAAPHRAHVVGRVPEDMQNGP